MPTLQPFKGDYYLWKYIPSLVLSLVFMGIFLVATLLHLWKMVVKRMWFCTPFVLGGLFEVIGYASRAGAYNDTGSMVPYLLQSLFLLLAPIFFAATLYMVYSRIVRAVHAEHLSLITPRWTTRLFVFFDFFFLSIQSNGGGLLAKDKTAQIGTDIIVVGLILQVLGFIGFMVCCFVFHKRFSASQRRAGNNNRSGSHDAERANGSMDTPPTSLPWRSCLFMLYITSLAVLARNLYRVVEFSMGVDGFLQAHEWPVYAFDAALMLLVMIVFFIWHPSTLYPDGMPTASSDSGNGPDQRESMIELTGTETTFGRGENGAATLPESRYKEHKGDGLKLEDWFWPAKVWSLITKRR